MSVDIAGAGCRWKAWVGGARAQDVDHTPNIGVTATDGTDLRPDRLVGGRWWLMGSLKIESVGDAPKEAVPSPRVRGDGNKAAWTDVISKRAKVVEIGGDLRTRNNRLSEG